MSKVVGSLSHFSTYLNSYWSCFKSFFGPNRSCKFVVKDGCSTIVSCAAEFLSEFSFENPLCEIIDSSLKSHHDNSGCGTATMLVMFYFWHQELMRVQNEGMDIRSIFVELDSCLESAISCLDQISISLKSRVLHPTDDLDNYSHLEKGDQIYEEPPDHSHSFPSSSSRKHIFLRNSRHMNTDNRFSSVNGPCTEVKYKLNIPFLQNECFGTFESISQLVCELGHGNDLSADLLAKAWSVQMDQNKLKNFSVVKCLKLDLTQITTLTIKSAVSHSRVIGGLMLKVNLETSEILSHSSGRPMRGLLINGNVTHSFIHKGVNLPFKSAKFEPATQDIQKNSTKILWISNIVNTLKKLKIDILLISGCTDEDLFSNLCGEEISVINHINARSLEALASASGAAVASYINDCDELNVVVGITASVANDCDVLTNTCLERYIVLHAPEAFQTIVICHPVPDYLGCLEHTFWHIAHKLSKATTSDKILPGKGATEEYVASSLNTLSSNNTISYLAKTVIASGLKNYSETVRQKVISDNCCVSGAPVDILSISPKINDLALDDYLSKIESWKAALSLVCLVAQTDMMIVSSNFEKSNKKNYPNQEWLGTI